jgi:indoleamine 2,3-dioxygenase
VIPNEVSIPTSDVAHLEALADDLPALLESRQVRSALEALPLYEMSGLAPHLDSIDFRIVERLMQIYSYFASAYVYATHEEPAHRIPQGVAVPLVQLAAMVERPPILSYSGYVLNNWRRVYSGAPLTVDTLSLNQNFLGNRDESWFILIHADIEARAAGALQNVQVAARAAAEGDIYGLEGALTGINQSLRQMIETFQRMPEGCDPNFYYFKVRPYIFGFNDVVYEGAYGDQPQSFRGQTGAQSSIIPALVAALSLRHERTGLTHHLEVMLDYMPKPHREFIARMKGAVIREQIVAAGSPSLAEIYNECLRQVMAFRSQHYTYATQYIFERVKNPIGTGGTVFMDWLKQLIVETEAQLV